MKRVIGRPRRRLGDRSRRRTVIAAAAIVLTTAVTLAACGTPDDPALTELRSDPMATTTPAGTTLTTADDVARSDGGILFGSKPTFTRVLRSFTPDGPAAEQVQADLERSATAAGWALQPATPLVQGVKEFAFGRGLISIYTNTFVQPAQVVVVLEPAPVEPGGR